MCVAKYGEAGVEQVAKVASGRTGPLVNHSPDDESQAPFVSNRQTDIRRCYICSKRLRGFFALLHI